MSEGGMGGWGEEQSREHTRKGLKEGRRKL